MKSAADAIPSLMMPRALHDALEAHRAGFSHEMLLRMEALIRPCVYLRGEHTTKAPQHPGPLRQLLGGHPAPPVLGVTDTKFGGVPYAEGPEDWSNHDYLGQLNFADVSVVVAGVPSRGLLRIDLLTSADFDEPLRLRWFPEPDAAKAKSGGWNPESLRKWEAKLHLEPGWSLPDADVWSAVPEASLPDPARKLWTEWTPTGFDLEKARACHRILGWPGRAIRGEAPESSWPVPGTPDGAETEQVFLRLRGDAAAGIPWGSMAVYIVLPTAALQAGDWSRARAILAED